MVTEGIRIRPSRVTGRSRLHLSAVISHPRLERLTLKEQHATTNTLRTHGDSKRQRKGTADQDQAAAGRPFRASAAGSGHSAVPPCRTTTYSGARKLCSID